MALPSLRLTHVRKVVYKILWWTAAWWLLSASETIAARVGSSDKFLESKRLDHLGTQTRCCCRIYDNVLTCQVYENVKHCPHKEHWHKSLHYFPELTIEACSSVRVPVGPAAQACKGTATQGCTCAESIDADVPSNGVLKGRILSSGVQSYIAGFYDVAYGDFAAPSGEHVLGRWAQPQSPRFDFSGIAQDHCSRNMLEQLRPGVGRSSSHCYQYSPVLGAIGSESCLTLDLFTPAVVKDQTTQKLASKYRLMTRSSLTSMVFLFGGGFLLGDKNQNGIYDGRHLAERGNVIVVSVNYRVGVFGFLHHPNLQKDGRPLTNLGLQDQLQALRWINGNIAAFGGDANKISIFGESAGAMSICAHLASPVSRQLFQNAILESGNCDGLFIWQPRGYAEDYGTRYLRGVFGRIRGCARKNELKSKMEEYVARENECSPIDTAPLEEVGARCHQLFLGMHEKIDLHSLEQSLPFEYVNGCTGDYANCNTELPSGRDLDAAIFECAMRLPPQYVWVNQMGLIHRTPRKTGYLERKLSMDFTGLPSPPHLTWSPVVDLDANVKFDFAVGGGMMTLPIRAFQDPAFRTQGPRLVTAGFNRDEGSLFSYMLPAFFPEVNMANGTLSEAHYKFLMNAVLCPDWAPQGENSLSPAAEECATRIALIEQEYQDENTPSALRGKCCTKNPELLRVQRIMTDHLFACPTFRFLDSVAGPDSSVTTRLYNFDADDVLPTGPMVNFRKALGAFHFSELFFVFGDSKPGGNLPMGGGQLGIGLNWNAGNASLARAMMDAWTALGQSKDPKSWTALEKAEVDGEVDGLVRLFTTSSNVTQASLGFRQLREAHHCRLLDRLHYSLLEDAFPAVEDNQND